MALKFYASVAKGLKLKVRMFWGLIPTFVEVTGGKLVEEAFLSPSPPPIGLKRRIMSPIYKKGLKKLQRQLQTGQHFAKYFKNIRETFVYSNVIFFW